jgi:hypothetical protein
MERNRPPQLDHEAKRFGTLDLMGEDGGIAVEGTDVTGLVELGYETAEERPDRVGEGVECREDAPQDEEPGAGYVSIRAPLENIEVSELLEDAADGAAVDAGAASQTPGTDRLTGVDDCLDHLDDPVGERVSRIALAGHGFLLASGVWRLAFGVPSGRVIASKAARSAVDGLQAAAAALAVTCSGSVAPAVTNGTIL